MKLHPRQLAVAQSQARFRTLTTGRRFGKSLLGAYEAIKEFLNYDRRVWIVAPTNDLTEKIWREVYKWAVREIQPAVKNAYTARGHWRLESHLGSILECKSADDPNSLIGESLTLLIMDEASRVKEIAWSSALRPTLADRKGRAIFISTPKGKNWYYQLHLRGLEPDGVYESWQLPSTDNPYLDPLEVEQAKKDAPLTFEQEWEARFMDDAGQVFRKIRENAVAQFEEPQSGVGYVMGVDLAKTEDWTVIFVMRMDNQRVVHFDRFQGLTWDMQIPRIQAVANRYNRAKMLIDSTGVGDPVFDTLRTAGANVEGYKFTNPSKENLIRGLMIALENSEVSYPMIDVLINELEAFGYNVGPTGIVRYSAPDGFHDDCVIALALVIEAAKTRNTGVLEFYKELTQKNESDQAGPKQFINRADLQAGEFRIT